MAEALKRTVGESMRLGESSDGAALCFGAKWWGLGEKEDGIIPSWEKGADEKYKLSKTALSRSLQ